MLTAEGGASGCSLDEPQPASTDATASSDETINPLRTRISLKDPYNN
jgi:hypothetical protein